MGMEGRPRGRGTREAWVGWRRFPAATGRPLLTLPIDEPGRRRIGHPFPPYVSLRGHGHVREYRVAPDHRHAVGVGFLRRSRVDPQTSRFRDDRAEVSGLARPD